MELKLKYLKLEGVQLAYEEYGQGETILFLHGFGASSYSWRAVAKLLSESASKRTICLNLMGFGHSDKPKNMDYTINNQANLVIQFIERLGLDSVTLAGHSYGGGVCLVILYQLSQKKSKPKIKNLILASSPCYPMEMPQFLKLLSIPILPHLILRLIPSKRIIYKMIQFDLPDLDLNSATIQEYAHCLDSPGCHQAMVKMARGIIPDELESMAKWYPSLDIPSLFIWGEFDGLIPVDQAQRLHKAIPGSKLAILKNCGHIPQEQFPIQVHEH